MSSDDARGQATAGWFTIAMGLVFGGAGVIIAALAVAIDYTLKRDRNPNRRDWWRQSVADSELWLARDRERRQAWREARREWWRDGADPEKRPAKPSGGMRIGAWMRRAHARATVGANRGGGVVSRFWRGFLAGWSAADAARRDGARFRDITKARPGTPTKDAGQPEADGAVSPVEDQPATATPAKVIEGEVVPEPAAAEEEAPVPAATPERAADETAIDVNAPAGAATDSAGQQEPTDRNQGTGDQTMTAPVGETHLDLTAQGLGDVNHTLAEVEQHNDALAALRQKLQQQVQELNERVTTNGGTAQTQQALDEANRVIEMIGQIVGNLADASAEASDTTAAAEAGLAPARDAQDTLHSSGARGEFVTTAAS